MALKAPRFPNEVWDGTSEDRESRLISTDPSSADWDRIVAELIATQTAVLESGGGGTTSRVYLDSIASSGDGTPENPWKDWKATIEAGDANTEYVLSSGNYDLSATLAITGFAAKIRGEAMATIIWSGGAAPMMTLSNSTGNDTVIFEETSGADVSNLTLNGNQTATHGIKVISYSGANVHDIEVGDLAPSGNTYAFWFGYAVTSRFKNLIHTKDRWTTHPKYAFYQDSVAGASIGQVGCYDCIFEGCRANGYTGKGWYIKMGQWNTYTGCFIWDGSNSCTHGLHIDTDAEQNTFIGFDSENNQLQEDHMTPTSLVYELLCAGSRNTFIAWNSPAHGTPYQGVLLSGDGNTFQKGRAAKLTVTGRGQVLSFNDFGGIAISVTGTGSATNITRDNFSGNGQGRNFVEFITANGKAIIGINEGGGPDGVSFANTAGDFIIKAPASKFLVFCTEDTTNGVNAPQVDGSGFRDLYFLDTRQIYGINGAGNVAHNLIHPLNGGDVIFGDSAVGDTNVYGKNHVYLAPAGTPVVQASVNGNLYLLGGSDLGGGARVIAIKNCDTAPTSSPTGGGVLYVQAGALKYKGSSGTVTPLAIA